MSEWLENQHDEWCRRLRPQIESVRTELSQGTSAATLADGLHHEGLSSLQILLVFREATGAALHELKGLGRWWHPVDGVTDRSAFDAYAVKVFRTTTT